MSKINQQFISADQLRQLLRYNHETGDLFWLNRSREMFDSQRMCNTWNARFADKSALTSCQADGYRCGSIFNRKYLAHRVAWALAHKEWPIDQVDHINGNPADNRLVNLRSVSNAENQKNRKRNFNNKTGVIGVHLKSGRYRAVIQEDGKPHHLGYFLTIEEAAAARKLAEVRIGFHVNHGRASS